jgi:peptidoglycan/xylan/chitin deacetylase (PgdA/CDA1 family)
MLTTTGPFTRQTIRAWSKLFWAGVLRASGLLGLAKRWVRRKGAVVLTFHRVLTEDELQQTSSLPGMIVRAQTFASLLDYTSQQCEIIDVSKGPEWRQEAKLKIAVTFDDGWSDNASSAYPIAHKRGAPMTIFIVPQRTGEALPFWPELAVAVLSGMDHGDQGESRNSVEQMIESLKGLPAEERKLYIERMVGARVRSQTRNTPVDKTMTWQQIAELRAAGVTFGSHTSTHEILTCIPAAQAEEEIVRSRELIEQQLGAPCSLFSYPNGNCSGNVRDLVAQAGYRFAFLNQQPGVWTPACDPFMVPRVNVCEYHLVNAQGKFSPLIFDYTVVWKAARGLLSTYCAGYVHKVQEKWRKAWRGLGLPARRSHI